MSHNTPPQSGKQRRADIMAQRASRRARQRMQQHQQELARTVWLDAWQQATTEQERQALIRRARQAGLHIVPADQHVLAAHNNTYGVLPACYIDQPFVCRSCGAQAVWTAQQQKWWFEQAGGHIDSRAVECSACRIRHRAGQATDDRALALRHQVQHLRSLHGSSNARSAEAQADVLAALESKWHGIRVVALGVVGHWWGGTHDPRWRELLREHILLLPQTGDDAGFSYQSTSTWGYTAASTALKALGQNTSTQYVKQELEWLIQHCTATWCCHFVGHLDSKAQHALLRLLHQPPWWQAAHQQPDIARKLPWLLSATSGQQLHTPLWQELARHYLASPCIQPAPSWLERQLAYAAAPRTPPTIPQCKSKQRF